MEQLPPKPAYRNNATTRWGLAASRLPVDLPTSAVASAERGESKAVPWWRSMAAFLKTWYLTSKYQKETNIENIWKQ